MDEASPTDEELIVSYRESGDSRFLDELFARHLGIVRGMMYQMALNHADADDWTQEVFLRVARGMHGFNGRARFTTWLYRVAMNCAKTQLGRRARNSAQDLESVAERGDARAARPDLEAAAADADARIHAALARLSPKLRTAISLTILQNLTLPEAARIEGCALATMYWRVHEARRLLKKSLAEFLP